MTLTSEMQTISQIIAAGAPMTMEQIIKQEVDEWRRSRRLRLMQLGQRYYASGHDILSRKRMVIGEGGQKVEDVNLANKQLVHTFVRKLVDQKIGYLLSKPFSVHTDKKEYLELLNDVFDKSFLRLLKNIGKDAVNHGLAWLQVYYDENGDLKFKRIPATEVIPLWRDAAHTELDALIRCYEMDYYQKHNKRQITKVEYWDSTGVRRFTLDSAESTGLIPESESGHFTAITEDKETPMNWERVPFIAFKYNDLEQPLIELLKSLVDDYDEQRSDNSNNLTDVPNGIYILKDYDGTDLGEFRRNLSMYRAVKVSGDGGVDTLTMDLNPEALEQHIEQLRKDIYEFGRGVDTQSEKLGNSPSGVALRFLYADLDLDANDIENEFQAGLEQLLWFVDTHFANSGAGDFSDESVEFIFNRDIPINETESMGIIKDSVGILSDETLVAQHPLVTDASAEMERIRKQKDAAIEEAKQYGFPAEQKPKGDGADEQ
ncbi:phage portal protein [Paenibacillus chitinolyticus]